MSFVPTVKVSLAEYNELRDYKNGIVHNNLIVKFRGLSGTYYEIYGNENPVLEPMKAKLEELEKWGNQWMDGCLVAEKKVKELEDKINELENSNN